MARSSDSNHGPLNEHRMMARIARYYYFRDMTQAQIAKKIGLSRQKVQRMLTRARDEGLVRITISPVVGHLEELEQGLEDRFDLREAVVVETVATDDQVAIARELGAATAQMVLPRIISNGSRIVLSWGGTLLGLVDAVAAHRPSAANTMVVQGLGGLGDPTRETHASDLARRLASVLGGRCAILPAPGIAGNTRACKAFLEDASVSSVLSMARKADVALLGIGAPRRDSILVRAGQIIQWKELSVLKKNGAVGDLNLRYFDADGRALDSPLDHRVIGLTLEEIRSIPTVVGIAGGKVKQHAIRGALAGKFMDVLVTDRSTAETILAKT